MHAANNGRGNTGAIGAAPAELSLLFVLKTTTAGEAVESILLELLARGHAVLVALEGPRAQAADARARLEALEADQPGLRHELLPESRFLWLYPATAVRRRLDHLRSLDPGSEAASPYGDRPPPVFGLLLRLPPFRWRSGRRALAWGLGRLEAAMPIAGSVRHLVRDRAPDRLLVSPLVDFGSPQVEYLRVAHAAGIPTVLVVAEPDDLRTKGAIRETPTLIVGWKEALAPGAAEAIEGLSAADVVARRPSVILRPLLWLLTPLLALLMPLMRPRATYHSAVKATRRRAKRRRKAERIEAKRRGIQVPQPAAGSVAAQEEERRVRLHREQQATRRSRVAASLERQAPSKARPSPPETPRPKPKPSRSTLRLRKRARGRAKALRRRWKHTRRGTRRVYNRRYRLTYRSTITRVPARDELPALLNARNLLGRGVEIGVKAGVYSDALLSRWHGKELISIDPWLSADPDEYVDRANVSQRQFDRLYEKTQKRLAAHGSRSTIWRMTSLDAAPRIPDHELDFVYIDARHDYDSVMEDIEAWCSKVKPGGILAGHDYVDGDLPQGKFYVKSAVDEFFGARGIPVHATEGPSVVEMFPTWIVEVPDGGITPSVVGEVPALPRQEQREAAGADQD